MSPALSRAAGLLLHLTGLERLPVKVRSGIAAGASWTLSPYPAYWRGTHEPAVQQALIEIARRGMTGWACWDLGAHFGLYAIGLARCVGPTGQVAAFEPDPVSFDRLLQHWEVNGCPWLKPYHAAASASSGSAEIFTYGRAGATTTHLPYEGETRHESVGALTVPTIRLDELVVAGELRPPQLVKIDVEGHGHHAVAGMRETLAQARPLLVIAFHSEPEISGILAVLRPLGYTWRRIPGGPVAEIQVGGDYLFQPPPGAAR